MFGQRITIMNALTHLHPTKQWRVRNNTYDGIIWPEDLSERPSREQVENKLQELIDAQPWKELRQERNRRLTECDWVTIRAYSSGTDVHEEWKTYLQALRDLPANTTDPTNPVWPTPPS